MDFHPLRGAPLSCFLEHTGRIGFLILLQVPVDKREVTGFAQLYYVEDIQGQRQQMSHIQGPLHGLPTGRGAIHGHGD